MNSSLSFNGQVAERKEKKNLSALRSGERRRERERERKTVSSVVRKQNCGCLSFCLCHNILSQGSHTHTHTHPSKPTKRRQRGVQLSSQLGLAMRACVLAINRTCLSGTVLTRRSVPLLGLRSLRPPVTTLCAQESLLPQVSEAMYAPRVTLPKLCNYKKTSKEHSSAWLARTMRERDKYLLPSTATATHSLCSSSLNAPPPQ